MKAPGAIEFPEYMLGSNINILDKYTPWYALNI